MPTLLKVALRPNWLPSLSPGWFDVSDRLMADAQPTIRLGVQRREDPTILTHGEVSFTFEDFDGFFGPIFDLAKIQGSDPSSLRAPLIHMGELLVLQQDRPNGQWRVNYFLISQRGVKRDTTAGFCQLVGFNPGKNLDCGNAERVHRFSSIVGPPPWVLFGYSIGHPAAAPGIQTLTPSVPGNPIPLVGTSPTGAPWPADQIRGNLTLFTRDLRIGNTITINGVSATIKSVDNDGQITLSSAWGGVDTAGAFTAFMFFSGQSDSWFRLVGPGATALPFFVGDTFHVIAPVDPALFPPGGTTTPLLSDDLVIKATVASGPDLLIQTTNPVPGLSLFPGQANMEMLAPWYRGKRYSELLQLLLDEVNAALTAAGYTAGMQLVQDAIDALLPTPFVDLIDENGLVFPSTGIAWAADGAGRAMLQASGSAGQKKPDILQDTVAAERTMSACAASSTFTFPAGTGFCLGTPGGSFPSIDTGKPNRYPNPALSLVTQSPPPDRTLIPQIGPDLFQYGSPSGNLSRISVRWTPSPSLFTRALPTTLASAYRLESLDCTYSRGIPNPPDCDPDTRNTVGYTLGRYTTVDNGVTWTPVSSSVQLDTIFTQAEEFVAPINAFAQGGIQVFRLGPGQFLYLLTDGGRMKASWFLGPTDAEEAGPIVAGLAQFTDGTTRATNAGNRSGAVFDGANVFYFEDRATSVAVGMKTAAGGITIPTSPSVAVTGVGTRFQRDFAPGDVIFVPNLLGGVNPVRFTVLSVTSDTALTLSSANTGPAYTGSYQIEKQAAPTRLWWWNGAAMVIGTLVGFPSLNGADFANAMIDTVRQHLYIVSGHAIFRVVYTFAAGTLTATQVDSFPLDQVNYDTLGGAVSHVGAAAWLAGPVDALQGPVGSQANFPGAHDAVLIGTINTDYILSDAYGGVIQIADFTGLSCAAAYGLLLQFAQMFIISGADQALLPTAAIGGYNPVPTVFVRHRNPGVAVDFDLSSLAVTANSEPWILQYTDIRVFNSLYNIPPGANDDIPVVIHNDRSFTFLGVLYKVAAARFAGSDARFGKTSALEMDNRFLFTTSACKLLANVSAFEFLIPRPSARIKVKDPFILFDAGAILPLQVVKYLSRPPSPYLPAQTLVGRVLTITQSIADDVLDLEIA